MFQSFFTGLSGMFSFSKNLDNVSNNVANMNTPGFKGSDTFYSSLNSGDSALGTQISGESQRFSNGEVRQTGNATDLAIAGEGFFVLLDGDQTHYTRAGQFTFDNDGNLVDSVSGASVAALTSDGQLEALNISNVRVLAPQASSEISFSGNMSTDMTEVEVADVTVFNALGEEERLSFTFTNNSDVTPGSWLVSVKDADGSEIKTGEIRFDSDGTPLDAFNALTVELTDSLGATSSITMKFGENGSFADTTSVSGGTVSTLRASTLDGHGISTLTTVDFESDGTLTLNYSNGESIAGQRLALANFTNPTSLQIVEGSIFQATSQTSRTLAHPGQANVGAIISQSLELSNVDLSREFADMIIIQRGYQASSRILNVANQLLEQLYENTRGR